MNLPVLIIALVVLMAVLAIVVVLLAMGGKGFGSKKHQRQAAVSDSLRALVLAQRSQPGSKGGNRSKKDNLALAAAAEIDTTKKKQRTTARLTLEKRLRYAHWGITPLQFRGIQCAVAISCFIVPFLYLGIIWQLLAPSIGVVICSDFLNRGINRRFKLFDGDYPVLLMSYVSLLKTGMSTIAGLEAAAKGLDEGSLVRSEVELLIERLRLGLTEEQAINAFGEDVAHPEIELFVQGLLLSRRVGGQLSSTLERLAKQVRKRQEFRNKAVAAVGMERSSIWAIGGIMTALIIFLGIKSPDLVVPAFQSATGQKMWQGGVACIVVGFYWMKNVTNIKI